MQRSGSVWIGCWRRGARPADRRGHLPESSPGHMQAGPAVQRLARSTSIYTGTRGVLTCNAMAQASERHTQEQLQEYLHCWQLPGGRLAPEQARALLAWDGTPDEEREALKATIRATEQQVEAQPLAPNQRRGHVGWLDRIKYLLGR